MFLKSQCKYRIFFNNIPPQLKYSKFSKAEVSIFVISLDFVLAFSLSAIAYNSKIDDKEVLYAQNQLNNSQEKN
jgi:hypothetical protein